VWTTVVSLHVASDVFDTRSGSSLFVVGVLCLGVEKIPTSTVSSYCIRISVTVAVSWLSYGTWFSELFLFCTFLKCYDQLIRKMRSVRGVHWVLLKKLTVLVHRESNSYCHIIMRNTEISLAETESCDQQQKHTCVPSPCTHRGTCWSCDGHVPRENI